MMQTRMSPLVNSYNTPCFHLVCAHRLFGNEKMERWKSEERRHCLKISLENGKTFFHCYPRWIWCRSGWANGDDGFRVKSFAWRLSVSSNSRPRYPSWMNLYFCFCLFIVHVSHPSFLWVFPFRLWMKGAHRSTILIIFLDNVLRMLFRVSSTASEHSVPSLSVSRPSSRSPIMVDGVLVSRDLNFVTGLVLIYH